MLAKKIVLSQLRKYLKYLESESAVDSDHYLDFMNLGVFVDLNRVKKGVFKVMDKILLDFEKGKDHSKTT